MGDGEEKDRDLYSVLGLGKECTASELKHAYKKLALRWHPDRCSASGNSKFVDEAKTRFQAIQGAYSVLSDENKRFLYDVGAYESDDDEENGMGDFLGEMAVMMSQTKPSVRFRFNIAYVSAFANVRRGRSEVELRYIENASQCFEDLQTLFDTMFGKDIKAFCSTASQSSSSSTFNDNCSNKRNCSEMSSSSHNSNNITNKNMEFHMESSTFQSTFCMGAEGGAEDSEARRGGGSSSSSSSSRRKTCRKQGFNSSRIPV
ncbi:hypothetical protein Scep_025012 [Stephania cephalantha]|uniref:J domain-containing protein n=1 Tax=Stephania cephalantha TaxID=152367 RepID=A0AAP0F349_9MAGN